MRQRMTSVLLIPPAARRRMYAIQGIAASNLDDTFGKSLNLPYSRETSQPKVLRKYNQARQTGKIHNWMLRFILVP